jgi:hypothetical protein
MIDKEISRLTMCNAIHISTVIILLIAAIYNIIDMVINRTYIKI